MKRPIAILLIGTTFSLFAYYTKPTDEQCLREAKRQYQNRVLSSVRPSSGTINEPLLKQTLLKAFEESITIKDNIVYKAIYQKKGGAVTNIGWGAFKKVSINLEKYE